MQSPLAIFDLDSTLLDGDCEIMLVGLMAQKGLVNEEFLHQIKIYCDDYDSGHLDYAAFERYLLSPLTKLSLVEEQALLQEYLAAIDTHFRPFMLEEVARHRRQGHTLLMATAANHILAQPIAKKLGFEHYICTWMLMKDGRLTGELAEPANFREGKARKILEWIEQQPVTLEESWAYSDSHNDLPILNLVKYPAVVTPDAELRRVAKEKGWRIIDLPKQTTPTN